MKYKLILIIRKLLSIFYVFPIKNNRIIFCAYSGKQYSCNPKYIYEELVKTHPSKFEIIWAFTTPDQYHLDAAVKKIKYKSIKYIYYVLTSKFIIENVECWSILPKRTNQFVINTWHGGGAYKRVGVKRLDGVSYNTKLVEMKNNRIDLYLSSSKIFSQLTLRDSFHYDGEILNIGMPRNDILINMDESKINEFKHNLNVIDKKILLYAPTFRQHFDMKLDINFDKVLDACKSRFGGEWIVLFRDHYYETALEVTKSSIINITHYPDMQELLLISDVLITDFSSCMWDFSLMLKPVFLYTSDLDYYQKYERDFYTPIDEWGFPFASTNDELIEEIKSFNYIEYKNKQNSIQMRFESYEIGNASKKMVEWILKHCQQNNF